MDYGQLAQLSSPGQSPLTSGIVDPLGYQRWQNLNAINQGAIKNSIPLAQTSAQMEQQKAKEFMMGAPGREDLTSLGNMRAKDALQSFPEEQVREKLRKELEDDNTRQKLFDYTADIAGEADAYVNAPDENSKQTILRSIQGKTIRMGPGKTHTFGLDPEKDKTLLMAGGMARASDPKLINKLKEKEVSGQWGIAKTVAAGNMAAQRASIEREGRIQIANINARAKENKPLSPMEQALVIAYGDGERIVNVEGATKALEFEIAKRTAAGEMKLDNAAEMVGAILSGQGVKNIPGATPPSPPPAIDGERKPRPTKAPPPATQPSATVPSGPIKTQPLSQKDFEGAKIGQLWMSKEGVGKEVAAKQHDGKGNYRLVFKDGTFYP